MHCNKRTGIAFVYTLDLEYTTDTTKYECDYDI